MKNLSSPIKKLLRLAKHCGKAFLHLAYPPICLHCREPIQEKFSIFCGECFLQLELIDPLERCPYCFSADFYPEKRVCPQCSRRAPILNRTAAVFDYIGPAADLIRGMKYGNQPYLAKGAAAFMAAQIVRLDWPLPDYIVPAPMPLTKWLQRGYNQSYLIGTFLSEFLNRPVCDALRRYSGDFSQAGLTRLQRMELKSNTFYLSKKAKLQDKCLLLVDDVMTTGSTLRCCTETLIEGCPSSVYGLTVCQAIQ